MGLGRKFACLFGFCWLLVSNGCASVISGRHANVQFDSYPSNAHVIVHDKRGRRVASINTPGVVSLRRSDRYFLPARYTATFASPGYQPVDVPIRSTVNPWILGNVVLGGLPGLIVDSATGATWKPQNEQVCQHLQPMYAATPAPQFPAGAPALVPAMPPAAGAARQTAQIPSAMGEQLPRAY
jgi:hypothetical protein